MIFYQTRGREHRNTVDSKHFDFDKFGVGSDFALRLDKDGKPERWKLTLKSNEKRPYSRFATMCCNRKEDDQIDLTDFRTIKKLECFEDELWRKIRVRKRAMLNWQKIKVVLAVIKLCGDKLEKT